MATTARYDARQAEAEWQAAWEAAGCFHAEDRGDRPKYYVLEMFPYPSGRIHMGHVRVYTIGDVIARHKRACGFDVLHPMGWDAFGMPAENAAMAEGAHPAEWTWSNIAVMRRQLRSMGLSYDWRREVATCSPDYYRHEQAMFLDMFEKGMVYRAEAQVNWDPVDRTVLANEQVIDGKGWRSGAPVEKRSLPQWMFRITAFADDLLDSLERMERWPDSVRAMQANWIGRSEGAAVRFRLAGRADRLEVFTTRPDTLFGASFCALSPDHPLAAECAAADPALAAFIDECRHSGTSEAALEKAEKRGCDTGLEALHPFVAGRTLPVYVANFVVMDYGAGAIFGVPAHDRRDLEFARKYGLPIRVVVRPPGAAEGTLPDGEAWIGDGTLTGSDFLDGMSVADAKRAVVARLAEGGHGEARTSYRLRDWIVSRQRYWGCPIPVIHCPRCGARPAPRSELPVTLPEDARFDIPATRSNGTKSGRASPVPTAAARRSATPTPSTPSSIPRGISRASPVQRRKSRSTPGRCAAGCRWTSMSAASSTRFCICCIRAISCGRCARPGTWNSTSRFRACSRKAWSVTRPIAAKTANGSTPNRWFAAPTARRATAKAGRR